MMLGSRIGRKCSVYQHCWSMLGKSSLHVWKADIFVPDGRVSFKSGISKGLISDAFVQLVPLGSDDAIICCPT